MTTLTLEIEPIANQISVTDERLIVDLADDRSLSVPLAWYPQSFERWLATRSTSAS
ncbi:hypothetical protein [Coleofasciculus chthonoplastes]|uniref:hypothetical protein n=1 Tax=Coleofasciculus chthonoplastes TaxID=64178 RepID=UPI0032FB5B10